MQNNVCQPIPVCPIDTPILCANMECVSDYSHCRPCDHCEVESPSPCHVDLQLALSLLSCRATDLLPGWFVFIRGVRRRFLCAQSGRLPESHLLSATQAVSLLQRSLREVSRALRLHLLRRDGQSRRLRGILGACDATVLLVLALGKYGTGVPLAALSLHTLQQRSLPGCCVLRLYSRVPVLQAQAMSLGRVCGSERVLSLRGEGYFTRARERAFAHRVPLSQPRQQLL